VADIWGSRAPRSTSLEGWRYSLAVASSPQEPTTGRIGMKQTFALLLMIGVLLSFWQWRNGRITRVEDRAGETDGGESSD
jgi:hypothetical protein